MSKFKIHPPLKLDVSDYFKLFDISDWNFCHYFDYIKTSEPRVSVSTAKQIFTSELDLIDTLPSLSRETKSLIGNVKLTIKMKATVVSPVIQNTGIMINNSSNVTLLNCNVGSTKTSIPQEKKRKVDHLNEVNSWAIESQEDIWEAWRQYLDSCNHHRSCLERSHVIECGYSVTCNPNYDSDLYKLLGESSSITNNSPFRRFIKYSRKLLACLSVGNQRHTLKALADDEHWDLIDNKDQEAKFVYDFFHFAFVYFPKVDTLEENEAMFNHRLLWPMFEIAADGDNLRFIPGEKLMEATDDAYNADATIVVKNHFEICILETSGKFLLCDKPRFGYDHVKGAFAALSMLRSILRKYFYATECTLKDLKVFFIHAREKTIHLWSFEIPSHDIQMMERTALSDIPVTPSAASEVLSLGNFFWELKRGVKKTTRVIKKMEEEHNDYMLQLQLGEKVERRTNLSSFVDREIKKPERGTGYGLLLPVDSKEYKLFSNE